MAEAGEGGVTANVHHGVTLSVIKDETKNASTSSSLLTPQFSQKLIAELLGTYFLIFAGCGSIVVNADKKVVSFPGVAITWGLVVMVMVYTVGHISGGHFNPAVSIAFASCKKFPWKEVPGYIVAQVLGSILSSGSLRLIFSAKDYQFAVNAPAGSNVQSLVLEFIITFLLMFVIVAVTTDDRAVGELAGVVIGSTILLNALYAGPISGASMNPARSLGPALVSNRYGSLWIYILGPTAGAVAGACVYNIIRFTDKPMHEITKRASFLGCNRSQ